MSSTQTNVNASTARKLADELEIVVKIDTDIDVLVLVFRPDYIVRCATLEEACNEIRAYV
jgi:hypothetical protein